MAGGPSRDVAALLDRDEYAAAREACLEIVATAEFAEVEGDPLDIYDVAGR